MFRIVGKLLSWLGGTTWKLLLLAGAILLIWGTLAPVGTLVWWVNQDLELMSERKNRFKNLPSSKIPNSDTNSTKIDCYIVFYTGVGDYSTNQLTPGEEKFLDRLLKKHPDCVSVRDVFPYSAANKSLGAERLLSPLWRFAEGGKGWSKNADILIKIRNLWRFAISIDDRYGPVYNRGIASATLERMQAVNSIPTSSSQPLKLILIGTSGGAQIALGAADYLDQWLNARIFVVSVGGAFSGGEGFDAAERVYHLQGTRDWIEDIPEFVFPSRWSITVSSPFNRAKQQGHYIAKISGSHTHDGDTGYFGRKIVPKANYTYLDLTLRKIERLPIW
ncbi:MAG: hypothetical protein KME09_10650 [Pleurocapsa minor HA4230-MV1]|jgi:hypothetical protein|nr:hypothetical protein [Pleurocapsa minor HA4230-MV1]